MPDKIIVKGIAIHPARLATSHTFFEDSKSSTTPEEMVRRIRTFEIPNISVAGFHAWSEEMCNAMIISRTSALFLEDPPKASTDHGLAAQHTWKKILRESCPDFNLPPGKNLNDSLKLIEHRIKTSTLPSAAKKFYEATNVSCASPSDLLLRIGPKETIRVLESQRLRTMIGSRGGQSGLRGYTAGRRG
ncbi:uncharacterized protein BROUX77_006063 [Berkeleyomyces rouxiae]|uniref:uncharacterized protein n=1 Tax=Berkeleyomyces rouxiae TaxID=2035830 RepID=UPI003B8134DF